MQCDLHVQGHQLIANTVEFNTEASGEPLGQVFDFSHSLPGVAVYEHLWEGLKAQNMFVHTQLSQS